MTNVEEFLREAATLAGVSTNELLTRILHVSDGALAPLLAETDDQTAALVVRLDREFRVRNPGLHYVVRKKFIGYRREGSVSMPTGSGERSQIFASIIRNASRLEVVLPVDPDGIGSIPNAQDLRGRGRHGVGDVRVSLRSDADLERFLSDFDYWLTPKA